MPPGSVKSVLFYDSFRTSCQSYRCCSSCVFAVASATCHRVICALTQPPLSAPVICENSVSARKKQQLYEFPLNLSLDDSVLCPMRRFCVSAIGIESPKAANMPLTSTCHSPKPEPVLDSILPLTHPYQSLEPEPVQKNKPNIIFSKSPEHKGAIFTKNPSKTHDILLWPAVAKIVRGLGLPCQDDDFHCPMDCDTPKNHVINQCKKLELVNL